MPEMPGYKKSAVDFGGGAGRLAGDHWTPDGPARGVVLLLHGGGQTRHSWREAGPTLARDGWTAIAIDFRGHGDSDRAADAPHKPLRRSVNLLATTSRPAPAAGDAPPAEPATADASGFESAEGMQRLSEPQREAHLPELETKFAC